MFIFFVFPGFQLYVMLIEVFEAEKSRVCWYYTFGYGVPLLIVLTSCLIDPLSYGTNRYCWLRADNFFIFSFVGPVVIVILVSIILYFHFYFFTYVCVKLINLLDKSIFFSEESLSHF